MRTSTSTAKEDENYNRDSRSGDGNSFCRLITSDHIIHECKRKKRTKNPPKQKQKTKQPNPPPKKNKTRIKTLASVK